MKLTDTTLAWAIGTASVLAALMELPSQRPVMGWPVSWIVCVTLPTVTAPSPVEIEAKRKLKPFSSIPAMPVSR
jgi:hypothetical protein